MQNGYCDQVQLEVKHLVPVTGYWDVQPHPNEDASSVELRAAPIAAMVTLTMHNVYEEYGENVCQHLDEVLFLTADQLAVITEHLTNAREFSDTLQLHERVVLAARDKDDLTRLVNERVAVHVTKWESGGEQRHRVNLYVTDSDSDVVAVRLPDEVHTP